MYVDQKLERRKRNVEGVRRVVGEMGRCDDSLNDGLEAVYSDEILRYQAFFSHFFALNFSLRFASKQSEAKFKYICSFFSLFFTFFCFFRFFSLNFHFFSLNFRFASIFSLNFRLFYLRFRFRFLVFRFEVNHVKSGFFFASKRSEIFASISHFASEAKVRAHPIWDYQNHWQNSDHRQSC